MSRLISRDGDENAPLKVVAIGPADERPAGPAAPAAGKPAYLDTTKFVAIPRDAALASGRPVLRAKVPIDGQEAELPHDDPIALADFVECIYVLHGWAALDAIAGELRQMAVYLENPAQYQQDIGAAPEPRSGGVVLPGDRGDGGTPRVAPPGRDLSAGTTSQGDWPPVPLLDPAVFDPISDLKRRIGMATIIQVGEWRIAFDTAYTELRLRVLELARRFEEAAVSLVWERCEHSRDVVEMETAKYFQFHLRIDAQAALKGLPTAQAQAQDEFVQDLRARLTKLLPLAQASIKADGEAQRRRSSLGLVGDMPISEDDLSDLAKLDAAANEALAQYGAALAVEATKYPVLYRFGPTTCVEVQGAAPWRLGDLTFKRLQKTWQAADNIRQQVHEDRPARDADERAVRGGAVPEALIGEHADDSIWAYPKLIELTVAQIPIDDAELSRVLAANVRAVAKSHEEADARLEIVKGIGLAAFTMVLTPVCPPAAFALDLAMAASDVHTSVESYNKMSNAALCDLNPRDTLVEVEPSMLPVVLSIAGAAMVAL